MAAGVIGMARKSKPPMTPSDSIAAMLRLARVAVPLALALAGCATPVLKPEVEPDEESRPINGVSNGAARDGKPSGKENG